MTHAAPIVAAIEAEDIVLDALDVLPEPRRDKLVEAYQREYATTIIPGLYRSALETANCHRAAAAVTDLLAAPRDEGGLGYDWITDRWVRRVLRENR